MANTRLVRPAHRTIKVQRGPNSGIRESPAIRQVATEAPGGPSPPSSSPPWNGLTGSTTAAFPHQRPSPPAEAEELPCRQQHQGHQANTQTKQSA